ncbi:MAG: hypothetical protein F6K30_16140 [Cyanothece sp. SIO2G6]|nr:hypothetical protein [Cyanothece sp. SIO2G6]
MDPTRFKQQLHFILIWSNWPGQNRHSGAVALGGSGDRHRCPEWAAQTLRDFRNDRD